MANQQLLDYIKQSLRGGASKESIAAALLQQGWRQQDIDEAFAAVSNNPTPVPQPPGVPQASLPGARALLGQAWSLYKQRLGTFLGVMILPMVMLVVLAALIAGGGILLYLKFATGGIWLFIFLFVAFFIILSIGQTWGLASLLYAIKDSQEKIGVIESYRRGWRKLFSYWWVSLLVAFITAGGFLLFIVPGIIFAVWFSLAALILIAEDVRGMDALLKSREYVRGRWGGVAWRLVFVVVLSLVASIIPNLILNSLKIHFGTQISSFAVGLFLTPLTATYLFLLYGNLKATRGEFAFAPTKGQKAKFVAFGVLGILIPMALGIALFVRTNSHVSPTSSTSGASNSPTYQRDTKRLNDVLAMQFNLSTYYNQHHAYPPATATSICESVSSNLSNALGRTYDDPTPGQSYMYAVDSITNPQHYVVSAKLENPNDPVLSRSGYGSAHGTVLGCDCTGPAYCFQQ